MSFDTIVLGTTVIALAFLFFVFVWWLCLVTYDAARDMWRSATKASRDEKQRELDKKRSVL